MPPSAILDKPPITEVLEETLETNNFDEVLQAFPEQISGLGLEDLIDVRNKVVSSLVEEGISTEEGIKSGEKHAGKSGSVLDNAELLKTGAYEINEGEVVFKSEVVQQVFNNWQTGIGEATKLAGDQLSKISQDFEPETGQYETALGGSIDMLVRGLDMTIALARKDPRFIPEVRRSMAEARNEITLTKLASEFPNREFVVFESSPFAHKLLQETGEDFARRRYYDPDGKTAMHRTHIVGGNNRSYISTPVDGDSMDLWNKVYGDSVADDADRIGSLVIVDVTGRQVDLAEAHVMAVANIDQAQTEIIGETTFAGKTVENEQVRQNLYDKALEQAKNIEVSAIENAHKMTQLSIQIAETLLTKRTSSELEQKMQEALLIRNSRGEPVLNERQRDIFNQALVSGFSEQAGSILQQLVLFQESARSTDDTDRLASLLGPEHAATVANGGDIESVTMTAFSEGKRASGCAGSDEKTAKIIENIKLEPLKKANRLKWEGDPFKLSDYEVERQFEEMVIAEELRISKRANQEQMLEEVNIFDLLSINTDLSGDQSQFEDESSLEYEPMTAGGVDEPPRKTSSEVRAKDDLRLVLGNLELTTVQVIDITNKLEKIHNLFHKDDVEGNPAGDSEHQLREPSELEQPEVKVLELTSDALLEEAVSPSLDAELIETNSEKEYSINVIDAYEAWLYRLMILTNRASEARGLSEQLSEQESTTEELYRLLEVFEMVAELSESQDGFEQGFELLLNKFKVELVTLLEDEFQDYDHEMINKIIGILDDPEARQEIVGEIAKSINRLDAMLVRDLLNDELSEEIEMLIIQMLNIEQISDQELFTEEEIDELIVSLEEGRLSRETIFLIRKFVLYQQLEILIPDESLRLRLIENGLVTELLQLKESDNPTSSYLVDRLISSAAGSSHDEVQRVNLKKRLGEFLVACCSLNIGELGQSNVDLMQFKLANNQQSSFA